MKKFLSLALAFIMMLSLFSSYAFAEDYFFLIEDAYVYEGLRGEDGKFHEIKVPITDNFGTLECQIELNGTTETTYGTITCSDQQGTTPWEAGEVYTVSYNDGQTFNVEVLEMPLLSMDIADCYAFYSENEGKFIYNHYTEFSFIGDSGSSGYGYTSVWLHPMNFDESTPYGYGYDIPIAFSDQQEEPWEAGQTYEITASACGITDTFFVKAVELESITVETVEVMEKCGALNSGYDGEDGWVEEPWMEYPIDSESITLHFKDDTSFFGSPSEIMLATGDYPSFSSDQAHDNQWGVGEHTATVSLMGATFEYTVRVLENPIESIVIEDIEVIEGTGSMQGHWDENDNYIENSWMEYSIYPETITVNLKNAEPVIGTFDEIGEALGEWPDLQSDQSYENQWGAGEHTATVTLMGATFEYTIRVLESPVESIVVDPIEIIKGTGSMQGHWDENENYIENSWMEYSIDPENITVNFKDETPSVSGTASEIEEQTGFFVHYESDQSHENQWDIGEHTAKITIAGVTAEYTVEVVDSPIESIAVEDVVVIENDGEQRGYYDEESEQYIENAWLEYQVDPIYITINFKDDVPPISGYPYEIMEQTGFSISFTSDQSYENQWGIGDHTATISIGGVTAEYTVRVIENPIESIVAEDLEIIENTGNLEDYYDEEQGAYVGSWMRYDVLPQMITVCFNDGREDISGHPYWVEEETGYGITYQSDQSYHNQWGTGSHEAVIEIAGVSATYNVEIVESPIESIEVDPLSVVLGSGEEKDGYWGEFDWVDTPWMEYSVTPQHITVNLKEGDPVSGTPEEVAMALEFEIYYDSDQSGETPWGLGTHEATITIAGVCATYTVEIIESPVESIEVETVEVIEGAGWKQDGYWDEDDNWVEGVSWMEYDIEPQKITVHFSDGRPSITGDQYDLEEATGYTPRFHSDQNYNNQWELGEHTATISFMGATAEYTVKMVESPVESVRVEDFELVQGTGELIGDGYWDENDDYIDVEWMKYDVAPSEITVKMKSGPTYTGTRDEIEEQTGFWPSVESDQSYENPWGLGEHTATISVAGVTAEYTITIIETPIAGIEVAPVEVIEGTGSLETGYWDEEDNWVDFEWVSYSIEPEEITITFKDGRTPITGDIYEIGEELGFDVFYSSDQSHDNQWGIGEHTATITIATVSAEYTVRVVENPIESITVEKIVLQENSGQWSGYWDENDNYVEDDPWMEYYYEPTKITVKLKDGPSHTGNRYDIEELLGVWPYVEDDQSHENPWGVGEHTVTIEILGFTAEFIVEIVECPVESLDVQNITLMEGSNGEFIFDGEDSYFYYWVNGVEATVTLKGQPAQTVRSFIEIGDQACYISVDESGQEEEHWVAGGTYTATATLLGVSDTFEVTIAPSPVKSVTYKDLVVYKDIDSYSYDEYDEYYAYPELEEALLEGDLPAEIDQDGIRYEDKVYYPESNLWQLQEEERWTPGNTYTVSAYLLGNLSSYEVRVEENPIDELELFKAPDKTTYLTNEFIDLKGAVIRIHYADGSHEDITFKDSYTDVYRRDFTAKKIDRTDCLYFDEGLFSEAGQQVEEVTIFGKTCQIPVTVCENLVESITLTQNADRSITIGITNSDQTGYTMKLLDLPLNISYEPNRCIYTDKGHFLAEVLAEEGSFTIGLYDESGALVKSNALPSTDWYEAADFLNTEKSYAFWEFGLDDFSFNGTLHAENIDGILNAAGIFDGLWEDRSRVTWEDDPESGLYMAVVKGDILKEAVEKHFALEQIDLTLAENYEAETDTYRHLLPASGGGETNKCRPGQVTYADGIWSITADISTGRGIIRWKVDLQEDGKIISLNIGSGEEAEEGAGDLNEDGKVTIADAVLVLRVISGSVDPSLVNVEAGNVVKDDSEDPLTTADAIKILRYVIGKSSTLA